MSTLRSRSLLLWSAALCLVVTFGFGQNYYSIHEVRVNGLPTLASRTHDRSDVLLTSLDTILHDREVCCGKDSALGDNAERSDPASLKDIAAQLQGGHLLSDGRSIQVTAQYIEADKINSGALIGTLQAKNALLMEWDARLYVCYGVTYRRDFDPNTGVEANTILTFLLLDPRYSDARRELVFNRAQDDWSKVQGILSIDFIPQ